jgi:hypothetical protein
MNRTEVITGSVIAVLAGLGIGQLYFDKGAYQDKQPVAQASPVQKEPVPSEVMSITVDEVVSGFMTSLEQGSDEQKWVALTGLMDELDSPTYAKAAMSPDTSGPLAQAAIAAVSISTETPEHAALRRRVAGFIAGRTRGPASKEFVLKRLDEGSIEERGEIARGLGRPHGVRGKDVYEKVLALGEQGQIPVDAFVGAIERLGGKKAIEPILAQLKAAEHWKIIGACVTTLQGYQDPALLGAGLERLEQTGLITNKQKLPWISSALFGRYIETAEGSALTRGLRAAKTRPSLVKVSIAAVTRGLDDKDPETRRVAAEAVRNAVVAKVIEAKHGEELLAGRLITETEPVLKAELTGGLEQVRGMMPKEPEGQQ